MKTSGWYRELGLRPVINAAATLTSLGGSLMPGPVLESMADAARSFVDIVELQERVGARLAQLTHNEAGYVVSGAAAGITLAVAACIAGSDPDLVGGFPCLDRVKRREVVIERRQRNAWQYAAALTGARIVEYEDTAGGPRLLFQSAPLACSASPVPGLGPTWPRWSASSRSPMPVLFPSLSTRRPKFHLYPLFGITPGMREPISS